MKYLVNNYVHANATTPLKTEMPVTFIAHSEYNYPIM